MAPSTPDLADRQQASLRRVAALVAGGAGSAEVFTAVAREVAQITNAALVQIQRFEPEDTVLVMGAWGDGPHPFQPGTKWSLSGSQLSVVVKRTARPVRIDDFGAGTGQLQEGARKTGIRGGAAAPIVVAGEVWGLIAAGPPAGEPVPPGMEHTLAEFTELVATAIANAESRTALAHLADEQAALRRVATLVAQGPSIEEVCEAVTREVGFLLGANLGEMIRYTPGGAAPVATWAAVGRHPEVRAAPLDDDLPSATMLRTRRPVRRDDWHDADAPMAAVVRDELGINSTVGCPIVVEDAVWGAVFVHSTTGQPLPSATEERLANFTELVATAVANAQARAEARRLADEQAALRRVATLVAGGAAPNDVFAAVADELGGLIGVGEMIMIRYGEPGAFTFLTARGRLADVAPPDTPIPLGGNNIATLVHESGRAVRIDDYSEASGAAASFARQVDAASAVGCPIIVGGDLWGAVAAASRRTAPLPPQTEARMLEFTELVATAIANAEARAQVERLVDEQAALRRVATMVAQGAAPEALFRNIVEEVGKLLGADAVHLGGNHDGEAMSPLAMWSADGEHPPTSHRMPINPGSLPWEIVRTGEPARRDDWSEVQGETATVVRDQLGVRSSVGAPIKLEDKLWGAIVVHSKTHVLPPDTESRLERFAALVVTAVTNAQARGEVRRLADEQAALRRVATLVARGAAPDEVFRAVAEQMAGLLGSDDTGMVRYESDGSATVVASAGSLNEPGLVGRRLTLGGNNVVTQVRRTGRPARINDHRAESSGEIGEYVRTTGARSTVGSPVIVDGAVWGAMVITSTDEPLPPDTEERISEFTELVATAIANIEARESLAASRARVVVAADEERRRVVRDLHDGAQQRLVHTVVTLKLAERAMTEGGDEASQLVSDALVQAESANAELRELAQGILPAVLTRGGLRAGVDSLASRMPIPVELDVTRRRLPQDVEATVYFVVAEALTNVTKHANAQQAWVAARAEDATLRVEVRDDGDGGAQPGGTGLTGLRDRVAALGGELVVDSPAGAGTTVSATFRLGDPG